ncbi:hypothetical protein BAY59_26530 [Prauserella coralliicola]|nr:hypothetical protein BAY59_26530 [Prauserella coralliicola]
MYGAKGWLGFTFESVARETEIGKPAVYLRWDTREALLSDALRELSFPVPKDLGDLADELRDLGRQLADYWYDGHGRVILRLVLEAATFPELQAVYDEVVREPASKAALELTDRAIARDEIEADAERYLTAEMFAGAILSHYVFTVHHAAGTRKALYRYTDKLTEHVLRLVVKPNGDRSGSRRRGPRA